MIVLDNAFVIDMRKRLEEMKIQFTSQIASLSAQDPFANPDRLIDNAATDTDAAEAFGHDRYVAMVEELQIQLTALDASLKAIEDGTYGICSICHTAIELPRLTALPTALTCSHCEEKK